MDEIMRLAITGAIAGCVALVGIYVLLPLQAPYREAREVAAWVDQVHRELNSVYAAAEAAQQAVQTLSGEELTRRLTDLGRKTDLLDRQLASLQQIISPKNATDILTVARLKNEILAREDFEKRLNATSDETRRKVEGLQNWLLGLFATVIASLFAFAVVLLRRTSLLYRTVQALESNLNASQKAPNRVAGGV